MIACSTQCATWSRRISSSARRSAARTARDLRDDVDAVAVVLDHAGEPAHLAFDAVQPFERRRLAVLAMAAIYPLGVLVQDKHRDTHARSTTIITTRTPAAGGDRSGLRHDGRSAHAPSIAPIIAAIRYYFCSAGCRSQIHRRSREISRHARSPKPVRRRRDLHLPDASRRSARKARAPARSAAWRWSRKCRPPTAGPNPELADMTRRFWIGLVLAAAGDGARNGRAFRRALVRAGALELHPIRLRHAGRAVGRLAVLRARRAVARHPQPQHVHADRHGHRRRLCLQRRRHVRARHFPARVPRCTARRRSISKPPA